MNSNNFSSIERNKSDKSSQSPTLIRLNQTQIENSSKTVVKSKIPFIDTQSPKIPSTQPNHDLNETV